jgi:hypothetical protein
MTVTSTYLDAAGKPRLRTSVTGFIDVLGFSQLSTAARTIEESQQFLQQVADALRESRAFVRSISANHPLIDPSHWAIKFFSDNLVFGFPADGDTREQQQAAQFAIFCVQHYQLHMALKGFFVRGGVTLGPICLTDEIIFGSSLIESYVLESKSSIVPRVILTSDLQKLILDSTQAVPGEIENAICRDIDGWWFINYLHAAHGPAGIDWELIERHKTSVLASLTTTTAHDVLPKFGWSCRYHNVFCHWHRHDPGFDDRYRIDRVDEQSTIHLLKDIAGRSE